MTPAARSASTAVGTPARRLEGRQKVTGTAPYAYEHPLPDPLYVHPVLSTVARGRVRRTDTAAAEALAGVVAVMTSGNAPRLADTEDRELAVLQSDEVSFRGQFVGAVIAETPETARHAASLVTVEYAREEHDTKLRADRGDLHAPEGAEPGPDGEEELAAALAASAYTLDETYSTPMEHNNPMEPHATIAVWSTRDGRPYLTLYDSTQGAHRVRDTLAPVLGLEPGQLRVVSPHVGGGFGSKGMPHAHNVLAALAARLTGGRPAKLALTRQQMFPLAGHRTPTVQRVRLGADADGRLTAIGHDTVEHTSRVKEFGEQSSVVSRMMYAAGRRRVSARLAALDVPVNSWMRAPGEAPGMYAAEVAMDELAHTCGLDPVEFRVRNEPERDPDTGLPWSSRRLVECLRAGARRFGWEHRRAPGGRREGDWHVGLGVAAATYPALNSDGSVAEVEHTGDGRYTVRCGAADLGTGTWTTLTLIAADALGRPADAVTMEIGDTGLPNATVAGGSSGTSSWGSPVVAAARLMRERYGDDPPRGATVRSGPADNPDRERYALHSFGAHFAEVRVNADTGEIRVPRMLGVFAAGRIINPLTARSQFIGGMTMGLSMALHEESVFDHRTGHVVNRDLAGYHVPVNADVGDIEAEWLDDEDPHANPMGAKGIGEIGIVGSPAAVVNAVFNATGLRVRDLPLTPDKLLPSRLPAR